jgi:hypothetical protein
MQDKKKLIHMAARVQEALLELKHRRYPCHTPSPGQWSCTGLLHLGDQYPENLLSGRRLRGPGRMGWRSVP